MGARGAGGSMGQFYAIEVDRRPGELEYDRPSPPLRDWTPRSPRSQQVEDGLGTTGHFDLSRTPALARGRN